MYRDRTFYVYIMASKKDGVLYIGMTNNLIRRVGEHKQSVVDSFTKRYKIYYLVYYEYFSRCLSAIAREKQLKRWSRKWKIDLIEKENSEWRDLFCGLL